MTTQGTNIQTETLNTWGQFYIGSNDATGSYAQPNSSANEATYNPTQEGFSAIEVAKNAQLKNSPNREGMVNPNTQTTAEKNEEREKKTGRTIQQMTTAQIINEQISELQEEIADLKIQIHEQQQRVDEAHADVQEGYKEENLAKSKYDSLVEQGNELEEQLKEAEATGNTDEIKKIKEALKINDVEQEHAAENFFDSTGVTEEFHKTEDKRIEEQKKLEDDLDSAKDELKNKKGELANEQKQDSTLSKTNTAPPTASGADGNGISGEKLAKTFNPNAEGQLQIAKIEPVAPENTLAANGANFNAATLG